MPEKMIEEMIEEKRNKTAVITGGSRGIGAAIAAGFIVLGWKMACKAQEQDEKKNPK